MLEFYYRKERKKKAIPAIPATSKLRSRSTSKPSSLTVSRYFIHWGSRIASTSNLPAHFTMSLANSPPGNGASRPTWQDQLSGKPLEQVSGLDGIRNHQLSNKGVRKCVLELTYLKNTADTLNWPPLSSTLSPIGEVPTRFPFLLSPIIC